MYTEENLLKMLTSQKASVRNDAYEWIRIRQDSTPEIVRALERATHDEDEGIAERAKYALQADVHHHLAIKMGIIYPDIMKESGVDQTKFTKADKNRRIDCKWKDRFSIVLYPQGHAELMKNFNLLEMFIGIPLFLILSWSALSSKNIIPIFIYIGVLIIIEGVLWRLPVHCFNPDCAGKMEKDRTRIDNYHAKLYYKCWECNRFYEDIIFVSPPGDYTP